MFLSLIYILFFVDYEFNPLSNDLHDYEFSMISTFFKSLMGFFTFAHKSFLQRSRFSIIC